jgi:hypothetical protein
MSPYYSPQQQYVPQPVQRRPSTLPAYLTAGLFLLCSFEVLVIGIALWAGSRNTFLLAGAVGMVFSGKVTGNIDFGVSASMTIGCTTFTIAAVMFSRLPVVRWILAGLGGVTVAYYASAIVFIVVKAPIELVVVPLLSLLLWTAATVAALLPFTGRALRRQVRF